MKALELLYVSLNVSDMDKAVAFYCQALGFTRASPLCAAPLALANLLGVQNMQTLMMQRGRQFIELASVQPSGAPYPADNHSNNPWFQHCALVTQDIMGDYQHLCAFNFMPISRDGPQLLPGGIIAFKFRDPDGHPLELIQFPQPPALTNDGIDHLAIVATDLDKSIEFYISHLGLKLKARQKNIGPAQDALDDLVNANVDVVAMVPEIASPHLELLGYGLSGKHNVAPVIQSSDIVASRLVMKVDCSADTHAFIPLGIGMSAALLKDPDGHMLLLLADYRL